MIFLGFTHIYRKIVNVAIYALYPESFCGGNLAIRKVFAFSDSGAIAPSSGGIQTLIDKNISQDDKITTTKSESEESEVLTSTFKWTRKKR